MFRVFRRADEGAGVHFFNTPYFRSVRKCKIQDVDHVLSTSPNDRWSDPGGSTCLLSAAVCCYFHHSCFLVLLHSCTPDCHVFFIKFVLFVLDICTECDMIRAIR